MRALSAAVLLSCITSSALGQVVAAPQTPADGHFDVGGRSIRLSCGYGSTDSGD